MKTPSWFAPYGEGYCRICRYIQPLNILGRLAYHRAYDGGSSGSCKGYGRKPSKIPITSRLNAFSTRPPVWLCPVCGERVDHLWGLLVPNHVRPDWATRPPGLPIWCSGQGKDAVKRKRNRPKTA